MRWKLFNFSFIFIGCIFFFQIIDVAGLIDGTLIKIDAPSGISEPAFVDRHNDHSINLTVVCGPQLQFYFATAKCPGSVHDARALRMSALWNEWEINRWKPFHNAVLLGDSAYPLMDWLMVPIIRQQNMAENLANGINQYRRKHRKTRYKVENSIGILREEFPCLNHMRVRSPTNVNMIVMACVTLHNIQNRFRHGDYNYDQNLQRIVNRPHNELDLRQNEPNIDYQQQNSAIQRQRDFILRFN